MTDICIAIVTWPTHPARLRYFIRCISAVVRDVTATRHSISYVCSSESEEDPRAQWCGRELETAADVLGIEVYWREPPAHLGRNMNAAFRLGCERGRYVLMMQDDWMLRYPLDLSPGIDLLDKHDDVDVVRYSFPPETMGLRTDGKLHGWAKVDVHGNWPYGDDPHIRRHSFGDRFSLHKEEGPHGISDPYLNGLYRKNNAQVVLADRRYFGQCSSISSVINDVRPGHAAKRYE